MSLSSKDIELAAQKISPSLRRTPLLRSPSFERRLGVKHPVYFKVESLQHTGSFKARGALNKLLSILDSAKTKGVITASAGNHAQGVAFHAHALGIRAKIVMPLRTPLIKLNSTKQWGAEVILFGDSYQEAFEKAKELQASEGREYIHAFDDEAIIAGQGTLAKEILEDLPETAVFVCPIGGGGLLAGCAIYLKEKNPKIKIEAVQAEGCSSFLPSLKAGKPVTLAKVDTIAEGMSAKRMGDLTFEICRKAVDRCTLVSDEEISEGMLWLLENERLFVEGCGGAAVAAVMRVPEMVTGPTVVVLSGGNLDVNFLALIIERGLVKTGRLARLAVHIPDVPGGLMKLTQIFAELQASIVDVQHERIFGRSPLREVFVRVTLETQGLEHVEKIRAALLKQGYDARFE